MEKILSAIALLLVSLVPMGGVAGAEVDQWALTSATFLGGERLDRSPQTWLDAVEFDNAGGRYVTGSSRAGEIATSGAAQTEPAGNMDPIIARYAPTGELMWATYWGSDEADYGQDLVVGPDGSVYVTGWTFGDFPTTPGAIDECHSEDQGSYVVRFSSLGELMWSACFGVERAYNIDLTPRSTIVITGDTDPSDRPDAQLLGPGGAYDIFVLEISPDGSTELGSTLIGGTGVEGTADMVLDEQGAVYLTGGTTSDDWPVTQAAPDQELQGRSDALIVKLSPDLDTLEYSSFEGQEGNQEGHAIDVDALGQACAAGDHYRGSPTTGQHAQWIACLDPEGTEYALSRGYYPDGNISTQALTFLPNGRLLVAGSTDVAGAFLADPIQSQKAGGSDGWFEEVEVADPETRGETYFATYLGGSDDDLISDVDVGADGAIAFVGQTDSPDMPLVNPARETFTGSSEGYLGVLGSAVDGCGILGTEDADRVWGTSQNDKLCGLGGDDAIRARHGKDSLFGGTGDDRLFGGSGRDRAIGGRGDDTCRAERIRSC